MQSEKNLLELEAGYQMSTDGELVKEQNYLRIDTTELSVAATTDRIIETFDWK
ncbi:MAG: hypothetical protein AAF847_15525 [Bacteroidota bacterium]